MIDDSVPWKESLLRVADSLERRTRQRRWTERTSYLVERDVMNAAYAIRKLNEARKISDGMAGERVNARRHALTGRPVDIWNRDEFVEHYDMQHTQLVSLELTEFCNQVIHSWVFMLSATETPPHRFNGVYVSSDRARKKHVDFISTEALIRVIRDVGQDNIMSMRWQRDSSGDVRVTKATRAADMSPTLGGHEDERITP